MRNPTLANALLDFAEEAALELETLVAEGAEVPFEVTESPGSRVALHCYRPLTHLFIREQVGRLGRLPSYAPASRALESLHGVDAYLHTRGEQRIPDDLRERSDAALRTFLTCMWEEATEFVFDEGRFVRAYEELEASVYAGRSVATVIAPVHGLALVSPEVPLDDETSLVRADTFEDAPREALWDAGDLDLPGVFVVHRVEGAPGDEPPVTAVRLRAHRLVTALRLFERGSFGLGAAAWTRIDSGPWSVVAMGGTVRPSADPLLLEPEDEDEFRAFGNLIARRRPASGELAWALTRFELGCERPNPFEALTDHLLAARALLEPEGPQTGRVAQRLSAICALPEDRPALAERIAHAISLERAVVSGLAPGGRGADSLVLELADNLRALLRDSLCGHLDADLCGLADRLLLEGTPTAEDDFEPVEDDPAMDFDPDGEIYAEAAVLEVEGGAV